MGAIDIRDGYLLAFALVVIWSTLSALWRNDWALARCALVLVSGEAAISAWFAAFGPLAVQPWHVYLAIYSAQCAMVTVKPSNRLCSVMGGLFLAGATLSLVHGAMTTSIAADWMYWQGNLSLGLMMILVLAGGASGETGRRIVTGFWRGIARIFGAQGRRGVA